MSYLNNIFEDMSILYFTSRIVFILKYYRVTKCLDLVFILLAGYMMIAQQLNHKKVSKKIKKKIKPIITDRKFSSVDEFMVW